MIFLNFKHVLMAKKCFAFVLVEELDPTMMCVCMFVGDLPPAVAEKAANRKHSPLVLC
jgi:hypothetical protein